MTPEMHDTMMKAVASRFTGNDCVNVVDVGSNDINGSFRDIFPKPQWNYTGLDIVPGRNVDICVKNPYKWREISRKSVDLVVSGNALEHIEYPWLTMQEIYRIMKRNGTCIIMAPSKGDIHSHPVDCWRIHPDGMKALADWAGIVIESITRTRGGWGTVTLIGRRA